MPTAHAIARHYRTFASGGNATGVNLRDTLRGITLARANAKIGDHNPIATLVFHMQYYTGGILAVLRGGELVIRDAYSFDAPAFTTEEQWQTFVAQVLAQAEAFATAVEALTTEQLEGTFVKPAYGTVYDNLTGNLEHQHYHLGQVALLKKLV